MKEIVNCVVDAKENIKCFTLASVKHLEKG
jgi:hypothetical protein